MLNIKQDFLNNTSPHINDIPLLKAKREREESICPECKSSNEPILEFKNRIELMNHLYDKILNADIDNKTKNDLLLLNLPNKSISLSLCNNCLVKIVITKGLNYLTGMDNKTPQNDNKEKQSNNDNNLLSREKVQQIEKNLYKIYVNYIYKKLENLKATLTRNSIETEQIMNKMALHLMMGENKFLFEKFNDNMNSCKSLLQKDRETLLDIIEKSFKNKEVDIEMTSLLDENLQNFLTDEKVSNLNNFIRKSLTDKTEENDDNKQSSNSIQIQSEEKEKKNSFINKNINQSNNNSNSNGIIESISEELDELESQSRQKLLLEQKNKIIKKKNFITIPSHKFKESSISKSTKTQIKPINIKEPITNCTSSPSVNHTTNSFIPKNFQLKQQPPLAAVAQEQNSFLSQIQSQLSQQALQMPFQSQTLFPQLYDPFVGGNSMYNLMAMKNMLQANQGLDKMQQNLFGQMHNMFMPSLGQNMLTLNMVMQQQQKLGQKNSFNANANDPLGNNNAIGNQYSGMFSQNAKNLSERNEKDVMQSGDLGNLKLISMFNEMAKQQDAKGKGINNYTNIHNGDNSNNGNK